MDIPSNSNNISATITVNFNTTKDSIISGFITIKAFTSFIYIPYKVIILDTIDTAFVPFDYNGNGYFDDEDDCSNKQFWSAINKAGDNIINYLSAHDITTGRHSFDIDSNFEILKYTDLLLKGKEFAERCRKFVTELTKIKEE